MFEEVKRISEENLSTDKAIQRIKYCLWEMIMKQHDNVKICKYVSWSNNHIIFIILEIIKLNSFIHLNIDDNNWIFSDLLNYQQ